MAAHAGVRTMSKSSEGKLEEIDGAETFVPLPASSLGQKIQRQTIYYIPSALTIIVLVLLWHFAVVYFEVKQFILPGPLDAFNALLDDRYKWTHNLFITLYAIGGAFVISGVLGILLGIIIVWDPILERTLLPILILFNTLPKIALAPLFVIWLGYGVLPNIVIGVTVAFFPMVVNTAAGLSNVDKDLLDLVHAMRATKIQVFAKIRLPNALPYIFTGLKLNATLSVVGAIVGEFIASDSGLGSIIIIAGVTLRTPAIFAALTLISFLGLGLYVLVVIAERLAMPWEFRFRTEDGIP